MIATEQPHVLIAGAGPGGLVAAKRLQQLGVKVTVIEKRSRKKLCSDVGGFYELSGNVIKTLEEMGLKQEYEAVGDRVRQIVFYKDDGTSIRTWPLPDYFHLSAVRRSDIQRMLVAAIGEENLMCGSGLHTVKQLEDGVEVTLSNGQIVKGDILIGADGIHSRVLEHVFPEEKAQLQFQNSICYWGFFDRKPEDDLQPGDTLSVKGRGSIFGVGCSDRGLCVWAGFERVPVADYSHEKDPEAIKQDALHAFRAMKQPWVHGYINRTPTDKIVKTFIYDREPLTTWHKGRVVLLGDAAHPMSPFVGQGANMAMIDGFLLGTLISKVYARNLKTNEALSEALTQAFAEFQTIRRDAAAQNVLKGRQGGEFVLAEGAFKGWVYNTMMKYIPLKWIAKMTLAGDRLNDPALIACNVAPVIPV